MKAHALLAGRSVCTPSDLRVLRYMATFRLPDRVQSQLDAMIATVVAECECEDSLVEDGAEVQLPVGEGDGPHSVSGGAADEY